MHALGQWPRQHGSGAVHEGPPMLNGRAAPAFKGHSPPGTRIGIACRWWLTGRSALGVWWVVLTAPAPKGYSVSAMLQHDPKPQQDSDEAPLIYAGRLFTQLRHARPSLPGWSSACCSVQPPVHSGRGADANRHLLVQPQSLCQILRSRALASPLYAKAASPARPAVRVP
jgi:hypothetical protein